ncbi:MAG: 2-phosphosulfolactate phosphatase [Solirubrobacteraceae bacterium]|nr:2-phosphosulfolactate phosphatase [Solirubrobacteraceae bacterium]
MAVVIDVAFTRRELRDAHVAVVIDVLRATTTATTALALGYREVVCVDSVQRALAWRGSGRVLAGERRCLRPPGFDFGNSPLGLVGCSGQQLVLATTNGAPTIVAAARCAQTVLLACMLNLDAVATALRRLARPDVGDVQIVCSGTDGTVALEDVYVAGRICAALFGARTDAARLAESAARAYPSPLDALAASADAAALRAAGLGEDIAYCARESTLDLVPRVVSCTSGAAIVVSGEGAHAVSTPDEDRAAVSLR